MKKRIGIMTGGGDAPGLNGIIEASSRVLLQNGCEVVGIRDGFEGVFDQQIVPLTLDVVENAHALAGTLLGSSNKSGIKGREKEFAANFERLNLDGLIACGGDGTFAGLSLVRETVPLIGVPKTIDNDLAGTEATFGFDTACSVVAENVDALRFTAEAHRRLFVVETMGRTSGWIALGGGLASYADVILIPERPFDRGSLVEFVRQKKKARRELMIVVSEGAAAAGEDPSVAFHVEGSPQSERFGGVAAQLARWLEQETDWEARHVVLGHLQRSRAPTTTDRFLTSFMGVEAARMAIEGVWEQAIVYRSGRIQRAPLTDLMQPPRLVTPDHRWVKQAQKLGLWI
ncbi:MAG: 6-phosphofructokinase [Bdellovibrionales bacterium]